MTWGELLDWMFNLGIMGLAYVEVLGLNLLVLGKVVVLLCDTDTLCVWN